MAYSNARQPLLDGRARIVPVVFAAMMPPRKPITVVKLADNFGQYVLILTCRACGHHRIAQPRTLAGLAGWDANLEDVVKRLRCSQCGKRKCAATVRPETKRDG